MLFGIAKPPRLAPTIDRMRSQREPPGTERERKENYKIGRAFPTAVPFSPTGRLHAFDERTATSVDSSSKRLGKPPNFAAKVNAKIAIATDDARCRSTSKQNMTYNHCWAGPDVNRCPARVTGIALRSAREPHSGTRNLAARALQGEWSR